MKKFVLSLLIAGSVSAIVFVACSKDDNESTTLKVRMTDAPIDAEEVNIDLLQVRANFRNDSSGWVDLNTTAGIYDLLGLQNGVDTLLAVGVLPSNSLQEIRFVLGPNNTIKVNGTVYPLVIPSGAESGLKLKINKRLNSPIDSILIDFDAALSIHQDGPGDYKLRPVLKVK
jgi:hypothetical protein